MSIKGRIDRRGALKVLGAGIGVGAVAQAVAPLAALEAPDNPRDLFQKHYKELTRAEMEGVLQRIEDRVWEERGVAVTVEDVRPTPDTQFAYALNLSVCTGNRRCVEACHEENNHDRSTSNSYIRVLEMKKGSLNLDNGNADYDHAVPAEDSFYLPVQCHQCDNPPCVKVCPVEATWKEQDGIVVVDYDWCIGCRYCEAACPYHARRFNWKAPTVPANEINPDQAYLSNRIRPQGVMEKCHWCLHRTRKGLLPACVEACPTGARVFGNVLDPDSEIRRVLDTKRVFVLKEELGTLPRFFYFFDE